METMGTGVAGLASPASLGCRIARAAMESRRVLRGRVSPRSKDKCLVRALRGNIHEDNFGKVPHLVTRHSSLVTTSRSEVVVFIFKR